MSAYKQRRRTWLYCQRTLREMLQRPRHAQDESEILAAIKRNQGFMALERAHRHVIDIIHQEPSHAH